MGRQRLVKLSDEEYEALLEAQKKIKLYGISTFSKAAQATVKNGSLGSYVHLGSHLIIEHFEEGESR